jgi:hypothetical protein
MTKIVRPPGPRDHAFGLRLLVQRFTLRPAPGHAIPEARMQVTLRPAGGLRLVLQARAPDPAARCADRASKPASAGVHVCPFHG